MSGTESWRPVNLPGFLAAITVAALSLSTAYIAGSQGRAVQTFLVAVVGWTAYLLAHYFAEGVFMDGAPGRRTSLSAQSRLGVLAGTGILVSGVVAGNVGIRGGTSVTTHIGALLFVTGYIAAHYAATGDLL
ncbi:MAG: hypothetical protein SVW02_03385 [Candidatus Nanohaloarchaea archaeon]|nr:hypothetical protein [Candidatus Nanohaloarchaea archaeon]